MDSIIDAFVSWKFAANEQLNRTLTVLRNAVDQSCKQLFTKYKLYCRCLISKFPEILILACMQKHFFCFLSDFAWIFFSISVVFPLCILGFNFHVMWLQFLIHQKFPLLSYDLNTNSLNNKDVKSSRRTGFFRKFKSSHSQLVALQNRCS